MSVSCTDFTLTCVESYAEVSSMTSLLAMLFGGWVENFFGDSSIAPTLSPVMVMIGGLNFLALLYGTINVVYTSGHIMMNAAATGHVFGKMSPYAVLRIAVAIGVISPMVSASGSMVSVGQASGMYIITLGSGAADLFWRAGVVRFLDVTRVNTIAASRSNTDIFQMGESVTSMFACAEASRVSRSFGSQPYQFYASSPTGNSATSASSDSFPTFSQIQRFYPTLRSDTNKPVYAKLTDEVVSSATAYDGVVVEFANGACGKVTLNLVPKARNSSTRSEKTAYYSNFYSNVAAMNYLGNMQRIMKTIVDSLNRVDKSQYIEAYEKSDSDYFDNLLFNRLGHSRHLTQLFTEHANLTKCLSIVVNNAYSDDLGRGFSNPYCGNAVSGLSSHVSPSSDLANAFTEGGWIYAPAAFSRMNGLMASAGSNAVFNLENFQVTDLPKRTSFCLELNKSGLMSFFFGNNEEEEVKDKVKYHTQCWPYFMASEVSPFLWNKLRERSDTLKTNWPEAQQLNNWSALIRTIPDTPKDQVAPRSANSSFLISSAATILGKTLSIGSMGGNLALSLNNPDANGINYEESIFDVTGSTNAIAMMAALGETLKLLWFFFLMASSGAEATVAALQSSFITASLSALPIMLGKMFMPLIIATLCGAFLLANVLPMIPMIAMAFVVVAFLIICAEALGGIALGAALLASAAGDGLLAVHGLRMAALYGAIFLRPTLHVIGLMLSFAMCNISLAYFNALWWRSMNNSLASTWDLFDLVMLVGGYPIILVGLLTYCLKAINMYANNLMSWIATEAMGQFGDHTQYVEGSSGAFNKMGGAMDSALGSAKSQSGAPNSPQPQQPQQPQQPVNKGDERPPSSSR